MPGHTGTTGLFALCRTASLRTLSQEPRTSWATGRTGWQDRASQLLSLTPMAWQRSPCHQTAPWECMALPRSPAEAGAPWEGSRWLQQEHGFPPFAPNYKCSVLWVSWTNKSSSSTGHPLLNPAVTLRRLAGPCQNRNKQKSFLQPPSQVPGQQLSHDMAN